MKERNATKINGKLWCTMSDVNVIRNDEIYFIRFLFGAATTTAAAAAAIAAIDSRNSKTKNIRTFAFEYYTTERVLYVLQIIK